ncbi:MAG TPA: hypothetical protein VF548_15980 [Allosphingosinicella sp.]|jgi:hypothetical protein
MSDEVEVYVGRVSLPDAGYLAWQAFADLVFAPADFYRKSANTAHKVVRQGIDEYYDEPLPFYHYLLAPASIVRKRLLIQGYTPDHCERAWDQARREQTALYLKHSTDDEGEVANQLRALEKITFPEWLKLIRDEVASKRRSIGGRLNPWHFGSLLSAPGDVFTQLALLIEALPTAPVWMDCTFLYSDEDEQRTPQQIAHDEDAQFADFPSGKIIVLTEGKSDTRIITGALRAFYPEYADAYQFLDFEEFRIEGGASLLARMIKVLSGARVQNRMLVLFDNDAAGAEAYRSLAGVRFPRNVRLMLLPDTKLAASYPTLGPAGLGRMNVNGAGAPIEMYMGRPSLKGPDGRLRPVRWTQWMESIGRYQGVVPEKEAVSRSFEAALRDAPTPAALRKRFPEMNQLLQAIFSAFEDNQPPIL